MHSDPPPTPAPLTPAAPVRVRARDWWRWVTLLPVLGTMAASCGLLGRKRSGWAGVLLLITAVGVSSVALGVVKIHQSGFTFAGQFTGDFNGFSGHPPNPYEYELGRALVIFGGLLWPLSIIAGWLVPNNFAPIPRRPWPEVTARATQLTARYGVTAYVICVGAIITVGIVLNATDADPSIAMGVLPVDAIMLAGLVPLVRTRRLGFKDLGLRSTRAGAGTLLAVSALFAYLVLSLGYALLFVASSSPAGPLSSPDGVALAPGSGASFIDVFAIAISAPVCEEIFFRGLLFRSLRNRMPLWSAALLAGGLFGLAHIGGYPLVTLPVKMIFGVLLCLLYDRTRSLLPGIAVHIAVDGSIADLAVTGNLDIVLIAGGAVLLAVLTRVIYNAIRDRRHELARPGRHRPASATPAAAPTRSASTQGPVAA